MSGFIKTVEGLNGINPYIQQRYYTNSPYNKYHYAEKPPKQEPPNELKTLVTAGILQGASILLQKASQWCGTKLMQGKEFADSNTVKNIAAKMLKDNKLQDKIAVEYIDKNNVRQIAGRYLSSGIDLSNELGPVARGENAFFTDKLNLAVAPKSKPSLILHELGHAINANKGKFLKFLQKTRAKITIIPPLLVYLNQFTQKQDGEKTFIEKNAGTIGFLAFLPTIIEEGIASIRGINAAKQLKNTAGSINLKPLKRNYAFAWMTYLISGIVFGIGTKLSLLENKK